MKKSTKGIGANRTYEEGKCESHLEDAQVRIASGEALKVLKAKECSADRT